MDLSKVDTEELVAELKRRDTLITGIESEVRYIRDLNINGITPKDFVIRYSREYSEVWNYSFYIIHEGKEHDIYYGNYDELQAWWPQEEEGGEIHNMVMEFVPFFMREAMENCYESQFDLEQTLAKLKECGFENIIRDES